MNILMIAVVPYFTDHHREVLTPHTMGWNCFGRNIQIFIHLHSNYATLVKKLLKLSDMDAYGVQYPPPSAIRVIGASYGLRYLPQCT